MIYNTLRSRLRHCRERVWDVPEWRKIYDMAGRPAQVRLLFVHYDLIGPKPVINEANK